MRWKEISEIGQESDLKLGRNNFKNSIKHEIPNQELYSIRSWTQKLESQLEINSKPPAGTPNGNLILMVFHDSISMVEHNGIFDRVLDGIKWWVSMSESVIERQ